MLDISKCEYEESVFSKNELCMTHYFFYPKDMNETPEFKSEEEYGNVVKMCIAVYDYYDEGIEVYMSPTVDIDGGLSDVDWCALYPDINYTEEDIRNLICSIPNEIDVICTDSSKSVTFVRFASSRSFVEKTQQEK